MSVPQFIYHTTLDNVKKEIRKLNSYYTVKICSEIDSTVKNKYKNCSKFITDSYRKKTFLAIYFQERKKKGLD